MLGYICKYAPVEVFESMGVQMERIEPDVTNFNQAEIRMHPNICSFAKGVLEEVMSSDYEGVILTTCCDSIRRLYDVLREEFPDKFIYMLDTPRITKDAGITLYKQRIRAMIREYEAFSGKRFDEEKFTAYLKEKEEEQQYAVKDRAVNIGIIYHTVQFCDNYAYEYAWLKNWLDRPMLLLETDYTRQSSGQVRTRIEAFPESAPTEC